MRGKQQEVLSVCTT